MPVNPREQPTMDEFQKYVDHLEGVWAEALTDMRKADDMYWQRTDIWKDFYARNPNTIRNRPSIHSGMFPAKVEQAVNAHLAFLPTFKRLPVGEGAEDDKASKIENGLRAVVNDSMSRAPNYPTKQAGKHIVLYNYTAAGVLLDPDVLQRPTQRRGESKEDFELREWEWKSQYQHWNPIQIVVPTPGEVLMEPDKSIPPIAVRRMKIKGYNLASMLAERQEKFRRVKGRVADYDKAYAAEFQMADAYEDVEIEEWWSARWHGLKRKGGDILYWEPNILGIQPWVQAWGGNAITPVGEEFNIRWWVQQAMMYKIIDAVIMDAQATASNHALLNRAAWARSGTTRGAAEAAEQFSSNGWLQGNKADFWLEETPDVKPQSFQRKLELEQSVHRDTFSPLAAGFRQGEADTATGIIIHSENTNRAFKSQRAKLEHQWSLIGQNMLKIVYRLGDPTYGYGPDHAEIGFGKDKLRRQDMQDQFHVVASFEQVDIVVQQQEVQQALALREAGLVGDEYLYQVARIEDVAGMRQQVYRMLMRREPDYVEQGVINAFREERLLEIADRRQAELDSRKIQRMIGESANGGNNAPTVQGIGTGG